jgi:hypothetical protein
LTATSLITGLAMLPISLIGFLKVGGNVNQLSFSLQPVLLGMSMGALGLSKVARKAGAKWDSLARYIVSAWLVVFIAALRPGIQILRYPFESARAPVVLAYQEYKRSSVWFPEFPLSGLLATGQMYHFSYGIFDRFLARRPPSHQQILQGIPKMPFTLKYLKNSTWTKAEEAPMYLGVALDPASGKERGLWREIFVNEIVGVP